MRKLRIALILAALTACFIAHRATNGYGVLRLTIVDGETNRIVPARIALRDGSGEYIVPDSALAVFGDCGKIPFHNWAPASAELQTAWGNIVTFEIRIGTRRIFTLRARWPCDSARVTIGCA
jgi:hypothetical protein